ncbi:MAG: DEAD/DEAH box helicase [Streptosporangiales bacterium]|nr:DEAD/DEAH box helicase [Streptosporangiales bacterium]
MEAVALTTFPELGVIPEIADALADEGVITPFPIQSLALPLALGGNDVIGQARTGMGKTYAFGVAMLQRISTTEDTRPRGLVVVPTRELAVQVTGDLETAGSKLGSRILTVYGGRAYEPQISALRKGVDIVVGTPGRLLDLVGQKHLDLSQVSMLVLDEADKMLDLGFLPDVERILELTTADRQTMLFSATMPGEVVTLSRRYLNRPTHVRAEDATEAKTSMDTEQHVFRTHPMDKPEVLARLLQAKDRGLTMVFCQTKRVCDQVAEGLSGRGFAAAAVHGDLGQGQRERALRAFRNGKIDVLVATDVAARGLDVDDVTHVVNYECPDGADTYVHRIGRTGRAGRTGTAVTFIDWNAEPRWRLINTALDLGMAEVPETYSTSEHLYEALRIPPDATGVLPKEQRERAGIDAEDIEDIGETGKQRTESREERPRRRSSRTGGRRRTRGGRSDERSGGSAATADAPVSAGPREGRRATGRPRAAEVVADSVDSVDSESGESGTGPTAVRADDSGEAPRRRSRTRSRGRRRMRGGVEVEDGSEAKSA